MNEWTKAGVSLNGVDLGSDEGCGGRGTLSLAAFQQPGTEPDR